MCSIKSSTGTDEASQATELGRTRTQYPPIIRHRGCVYENIPSMYLLGDVGLGIWSWTEFESYSVRK